MAKLGTLEDFSLLFADRERCRQWLSARENLARTWDVEALGPGTTALQVASFLDLSDVVLQFLVHGASPRLANSRGQLAVHLSCRHPVGGERTAGHLLAYQSPLNHQDLEGRTALHEAAEAGNLPLIALLLDQEANPLILTKKGQTAMDLATGEAHQILRAKTLEILERDEFPTQGKMGGLRE